MPNISKLHFPCLQICELNSSYPPRLSGIQHIKDTLQGFSWEAWKKSKKNFSMVLFSKSLLKEGSHLPVYEPQTNPLLVCRPEVRKDFATQQSATASPLPRILGKLFKNLGDISQEGDISASWWKHRIHAPFPGLPSLSTAHGTRIPWIHELCPEIRDWTTTPKVIWRDVRKSTLKKNIMFQQKICSNLIYNNIR